MSPKTRDSQKKMSKKSPSIQKSNKSKSKSKSERNSKSAGSLGKKKTKKSPSIHKSNKSKSKSMSKSKSKSDPKSKSTASLEKKSKPSTNKSAKSVGVGGSRAKSLSSRKSTYKQSVGRTVNVNTSNSNLVSNPSGTGEGVPMYTLTYGERLYDTLQLILSCPIHKKVAMCSVEKTNIYLPFSPIKHGQTWADAAVYFIQGKLLTGNVAILPPEKRNIPLINTPVLVELLRTQLPLYFDFVQRVTFRVELTAEACKGNLCADNNNKVVGWFTDADLKKASVGQLDLLLGPEPLMLSEAFKGKNMNVREVTITDLLNVPLLSQLLRGVKNIGGSPVDQVLRIYGDYLQQVSPSQYMMISGFVNYLKQSHLKITAHAPALFRAFASAGKNYINFEEFILGLLIVDRLFTLSSTSEKNVPSSGPVFSPAVLKAMADFVFRFYASANANQLSSEQVEQAAKDGFHLMTSSSDAPKGPMKKDAFTKILLEQSLPKLFSGTQKSHPLRIFELMSERSPFEQLHLRLAHPEIRRRDSFVDDKIIESKLNARMLCSNCNAKKYTLAPIISKLSLKGHLYNPQPTEQSDVANMKKIRRFRTNRYFMAGFVCNRMMDMIRIYAATLKIYTGPVKDAVEHNIPDWNQGEVRVDYMKNKIPKLCDTVKELLAAEPRIIKVNSPAIVMGDIHGNLKDLLIFEQAMWRDGFFSNPVNIVFLGNYVNCGDFSVETIIYLLCMKILAPDHVFLLRGNHEEREMHKKFTFCDELYKRFDCKGSEKAFKIFNAVFDVMPMAAIIDEQIFCCHSGIPSSTSSLEQMATSIPTVLKDPYMCELANEILWNDPITDREYDEMLAHTPNLAIVNNVRLPDGFLPNTKRNSGCFFSETALKRFLDGHGMSHLIRAHECVPVGYKYHAGGRCITIFSCSHYNQRINDAVIAYVHDNLIRVITVDIET